MKPLNKAERRTGKSDDLNDFDERLNVCFQIYNEKLGDLTPVIKQVAEEEEELIQIDEIWNALTDHYITLSLTHIL